MEEGQWYIASQFVGFANGDVFSCPYQIGRDGTRSEVQQKYKRLLWDEIKKGDKSPMFKELKRLAMICKENPDFEIRAYGQQKPPHLEVVQAAVKYLIDQDTLSLPANGKREVLPTAPTGSNVRRGQNPVTAMNLTLQSEKRKRRTVWYGYKRIGGKLRKWYLGSGDRPDPDRLAAVEREIAALLTPKPLTLTDVLAQQEKAIAVLLEATKLPP